MSNNLVSCNNLAVNQNLTVNGSITSSGEIQTTGDINCNDITALGTMSTNNLTLTGSINNAVTTTNLLSLDTTSSIRTQLNLKANDNQVVHNTGNETISGQKTFSTGIILNGTDLNTRITNDETNIASLTTRLNADETVLTSLSSRLDADETNIASLTTRLNTDETVLTSLSSRLNVDTSGNIFLRTIAPSTGLDVGVNNVSKLNINSTGDVTIKNNGGSNDIVLSVTETTSNKSLSFLPNCGLGSLNNITKVNGAVIASDFNTPLTLTQKSNTGASGVVIDKETLLIGSGTTSSPQNYLYFNSAGIGINKQNPAFPMDINGNVRTNDLYFTNYTDPILGNNTASMTQRWTALYGSLQNNIDVSATNSTNITTLQSQIATLQTQINNLILGSLKAYGRWSSSSNSIVYGSQFVQSASFGNYTVGGQSVYCCRIILNSYINNVQGTILATADQGYSLWVHFDLLSNPFTFYVLSQGGGASPQVQNNSFFFSVI